MLTIFGKKKKEDDKKASQDSQLANPVPASETLDEAGEQSQESPFAKIFQSISQDYQNSTPPARPEATGAPPLSVTPDWVQPRELPRSKPMIIPKSRDQDETGWEERKTKLSGQASSNIPAQGASRPPGSPSPFHPIPSTTPHSDSVRPEPKTSPTNVLDSKSSSEKPPEPEKTMESGTFTEGSASIDSSGEYSYKGFDDLSKLLAETDSALALGREREKELEKPPPPKIEKETKKPESEKTEKPPKTVDKEEKEQPSSPAREKPSIDKNTRGFEHIFELTQGALETPGLAMIDGSPGSGKTSVCLGLVERFLKQGSPCIFVTYGQTPAAIREGLKNIGCDAAQAESSYRLMIFDAFASQSGGFSFELYSLMDPWDLAKLQETLVGNCGMFFGEKARIIIDPIDALASKIGTKDFGKQFDGLVAKLKETGATVIASCDLSGLGKDVKGWAEDEADCIVELDVETGKNGKEYSLKITRLKGTKQKSDGEGWDIQAGKGLVFV